MSLTAVIAVVGGAIAIAESISTLLAYFDSKKQRRLDDVALVLEAQKEATHRDVVNLLSKDVADLNPSDREYLRGILERCEALVGGLLHERDGRHLQQSRERTHEALERLRTKVAEAPVTEAVSLESAGVEQKLSALAVEAGLRERASTTAYTPFGRETSGKHLFLLTPRGKYVLARIRIEDSAASQDRLLAAGFEVTGYSKDGFYSLKVTDADLGDGTRLATLRDLLRQAAAS